MSRHGSRWNRRWTIASIAAAAGVIVAGTAWGLGAGTDTASANGTDGQFCVANEVSAHMVRETENPGYRGGRSHGAIQITARPGEQCHIYGAPAATLQGTATRTASDNLAPRTVLVTPWSPAWIELDWSDDSSPSAQQTPRSITLDLNGSPVVVNWIGGGVDAIGTETHPADPVAVRSVQAGTAPYRFSTCPLPSATHC